MRILDFKGIGYGLAAFVAGYAVLMLLGGATVAVKSSFIVKPLWLLFQAWGQVLPVAAGYYAAYRSSHHPVMNGTIGGVLGMLPLLAVGAQLQQYQAYGMSLILTSTVFLSLLGAIIGKFRNQNRKHGQWM